MKRNARWFGIMPVAILLMACHLPAQSAAAGQPASPAQAPEVTGLAQVNLRVSDLDEEVNFFGKMGFEEGFSNIQDGHILQVFIKVNDMQFIGLFPQSDSPQPLGFMQACYESSDLNSLRAHYAAEGLHPTQISHDSEGNSLFTVLDTDSRAIEFMQYMPDSRAMRERGQHLGENRVSDTLLGIEMPVTDLQAAAKFYGELGFDVEKDGADYRLSIPANPDLRIVLHSARTNDQPQFLFPVDDAHRAADELHHAGLRVTRSNKLIFLRDPDGNAFVLLETGAQRAERHLLPWRK